MPSEPVNVLVVDDDPQMCRMVCHALSDNGLSCTFATDPEKAKELLALQQFGVMVADIAMPGLSGLDLLSHVKQAVPDCKVLLIAGFPNMENLTEAISLGAYDYVRKPFDVDKLVGTIYRAISDDSPSKRLAAKAAQAMELYSQVEQASLDSILALVHAVEAKDPYTRCHSEQVTHYTIHLARHLGATDEMIESLRIAALVHDIGKIGVPDQILTKPGRLTDEEFEFVRRHPVVGSDILRDIRMFAGQALLVRHHHEKWDGTGYPDALTGEEIPWGSRLMNIADSIDAMLMARTYKEGYPPERVVDELARCACTQFDPELAAAAVEWCRARPEELILLDRVEPTRYQALRDDVYCRQCETVPQE